MHKSVDNKSSNYPNYIYTALHPPRFQVQLRYGEQVATRCDPVDAGLCPEDHGLDAADVRVVAHDPRHARLPHRRQLRGGQPGAGVIAILVPKPGQSITVRGWVFPVVSELLPTCPPP